MEEFSKPLRITTQVSHPLIPMKLLLHRGVRNLSNKILQGSFLTISNALKQFPVLNVSYLKLIMKLT